MILIIYVFDFYELKENLIMFSIKMIINRDITHCNDCIIFALNS